MGRTTEVSVGDTIIRASNIAIEDVMFVSDRGQFINNATVTTLQISGCNISSELIKAETGRIGPNNKVSDIHFEDASIIDSKFDGVIPVSLGGTGLSSIVSGSVLSGNYGNPTTVNSIPTMNVTGNRIRFNGMGLRFVDSDANVFTLTTDSTGIHVSNLDSSLKGYISDDSMGVPPSISNITLLQTTDTTVRVEFYLIDTDADMRALYVAWSPTSVTRPEDHEFIMSGEVFISNLRVPISSTTSTHTTIVEIPNLVKRTDYTLQTFVDDYRGNVSAPYMFDFRTQDVDIPIFQSFVVSCSDAIVNVAWNAVDLGGLITNVYLKQSTTIESSLTPSIVKNTATFVSSASISDTNLANTPSWCNTFVYGVAEDNASTYGQAQNLLSDISSNAIMVPVIPGTMTRTQNNISNDALGYKVIMSGISSVTSMTNTGKAFYALFPSNYGWSNTNANIEVITASLFAVSYTL